METTGQTSPDGGPFAGPPPVPVGSAPFVPPDTSDPAPAPAEAQLLPGVLVGNWRLLFVVGWVGVMAAFGAVAQAGRLAGLSPWWIGPQTNPRNIVVFVAPFVLPVIAVAAALRGFRHTCSVGVVAGLASMAVALGDTDFPGMALVEGVIGAAGLLVSLACFAGRAVTPPESPGPDPLR